MRSFVKRVFDFTLALAGLALSSPLWLIFSLAVYLEDRGPVLFFQERCGRDGKVFNIIKFRSMKPVRKGEPAHLVEDLQKDRRVTGVGKVLRTTAMDELPVLINILKGDMSFVGPKPLPYKVEGWERMRYNNIAQVPGYHIRSRVKPGLTGMAQVYADKNAGHSYIRRFHYDNLYVEEMSLRLDLKLILLSFWISFRGKWEHRERKV